MPRLQFCSSRVLLCLFSFVSLVLGVPNLGIQRDWISQFRRDLVASYSAIITFNDASLPSDSSRLSDAQFINLAKVAYDEMVSIWQGYQIDSSFCPGAMIAMESEGSIYFASSVRSPNSVDLGNIDRDIMDSVGWFMDICNAFTEGSHRTGGRCAEPNVLRLYGDVKGTTDDNPPRYKSPPTTNVSPRVAVWGRPSEAKPLQNRETYFPPCSDPAGDGYGCQTLVGKYGFKPVAKNNPDPGNQDNWAFSLTANPRQACTS